MPDLLQDCSQTGSVRLDSSHRHLSSSQMLRSSVYLAIKRTGDIVISLGLLLLMAPVIGVIALLVKFSSRGPVIYSQVRVGRGGRPYTLYKVRSMYHDCERQTGPKWSTENDPRVTPLGRFLRKSHLDELPQLWNVLRGDMSLIGPRPERPEFVAKLELVVPCYLERIQVRPGITGLAQVQLPPDTDLGSVRRKVAHDLYYIQFLGFWMDLRIVLGTVRYILRSSLGWFAEDLDVTAPSEIERYYETHVAQYTGNRVLEATPHQAQETLTDVEILAGKANTVLEISSRPIVSGTNGHYPGPALSA